MIMDKINIIKLKMLSNIKKQLAKTCSLSNSDIIIFRYLSIIIVMRNFYQFFLIIDHFFWSKF